MGRFRLIFVTTLTGVLLSPGCGHTPKPEEDFFRVVERLDQSGSVESVVDSLALPLIASGRNIGMVVGVTTPEGDFIKAYGRKQRDTNEPMPADALFQVGSITKSFAAVLLAVFEQEGRLKLSDPINTHIPPGMIAPGSDLGELKFGELPSHTSGMPQEAYTLDLLWGVSSYLLSGKNLYRYLNTSRLKEWIKSEEVKLSPEKKYSYSNLSITLLGWVLGNIEGKGWRHHLHEHILKPLGMESTDLTLNQQQIASLTPGYAGDLPTFVPRHRRIGPWLFDEGISASGGIHSTVSDLLKYCKAAIGRPGSPLIPAFRRTQEIVTTQPDGKMAYSWFYETLPNTKQPYYHIAGIIGGHTSWVGYDRERGIGVVLMQNSINHDDRLSVPLLDRLVALQMKKEDHVAKRSNTHQTSR